MPSPPYHLEVFDTPTCTNDLLIIFGRAHMSYINQIFGDKTIRNIIMEIFGKKGKLLIEDAGPEFENSAHHVFQATRFKSSKICSVDLGYQNIRIDKHDTLCQSYSLMTYLGIPFDTTPSEDSSIQIKYDRQMAMIGMYRMLLENAEFVKMFSEQIVFKGNARLWKDSVDDSHKFFIIQHYKTAKPILANMRDVLDVWQAYGWMYFIGDGVCVRKTVTNTVHIV